MSVSYTAKAVLALPLSPVCPFALALPVHRFLSSLNPMPGSEVAAEFSHTQHTHTHKAKASSQRTCHVSTAPLPGILVVGAYFTSLPCWVLIPGAFPRHPRTKSMPRNFGDISLF